MNKYLLLRDNKESGPYTLGELIEKGIKPYDLVWLEGRSAAWRYPSELDELKRYAPVVEEQPYDRFYKRPAAVADTRKAPEQPVADELARPFVISAPEQSAANISMRPVVIAAAEQSVADKSTRPVVITAPEQPEQLLEQYGPRPADEAKSDETNLPDTREIIAKHPKVFVTLPGGTDRKPTTTYKNVTQEEKVAQEMASPQHPRFEAAQFPDQHFDSKPTSNNNRYRRTAVQLRFTTPYDAPDFVLNPASEPADKLQGQHAYSSNTPAPVKRQPYTRLAVAALTGICLLLGGVIIGLAISNSQSKSSELDALVRSIQERQQSEIVAGKPEPAARQLAETVDELTDAGSDVPASDVPETKPQRSAVADQKTAVPPATEPIANDNVPVQTNVNNASAPVEAKNTVIRETIPVPTAAQIEALQRNIGKHVSLEANDFKIGVLGGISGLELMVYNNSQFDLDQVVAEIEYLGPEKRVVKRQSIIFNNVRAGQQRTQEVPRTNRGVNINYSIKSIEPGKLKGSTTNL